MLGGWARRFILGLVLRGGDSRRLLCQPFSHASSPQVCPIILSNTCSPQEFPIPVRTVPSTRCPNTQSHLGPLCLHFTAIQALWILASK